MTPDLPESSVIKARVITSVVETVRRLVESDERRAKARGEKCSREQAIRRALLTVNKTTILVVRKPKPAPKKPRQSA